MMANLTGIKRVLVQILLVAILLGSIVGFWFTNKIGPWKDWRDTWSPYLSWTDDPSTFSAER